jgi:hypothetical protein
MPNSLKMLRRAARVLQGRDLWQKAQIHRETLRLGNKSADWTISPLNLSERSVVYSLGVGEDISFDLELIKRFAVTVHAFDPTPRSIAWLANQALPARFRFQGRQVVAATRSRTCFPHDARNKHIIAGHGSTRSTTVDHYEKPRPR